MTRPEALAVLTDVARRLTDLVGSASMKGSSFVVDGSPVAFVNASNAIVVHAWAGEPAATFTRSGSEAQITALILSRFVARRAA